MKATGIVRSIDNLGRVVIPKELRKAYGITMKDSFEIYTTDDNQIVLKKYTPACIFCSGTDDVILFNDKPVCKKCIGMLNQAAAIDQKDE